MLCLYRNIQKLILEVVQETSPTNAQKSAGDSQESIVRRQQSTQVRSEGIHSGLQTQGIRHPKSKTGVSVAPQIGPMSSTKLRSMHSSWMRTARLLTVSRSIRREGCLPWGLSAWGGVCQERGCLLGGASQHAMGQTPLPVNSITDRCKNITLPQTSFAGGKNKKKSLKTENLRNMPTQKVTLSAYQTFK